MPRKEKIIIVGAGLVGSLLTCLLAKRGYQIQLIERRSDPRKKLIDAGKSINLALSTRGLKALAMADMADVIEPELIPMTGRLMHDTSGTLTYQAYGKEGQFINSVSRSGLNFKLLEKADTYDHVELIFDQRCESVDFNSQTIHLHNHITGASQSLSADYIIGSDGAFSAIRGEMQKTDLFNYSQM